MDEHCDGRDPWSFEVMCCVILSLCYFLVFAYYYHVLDVYVFYAAHGRSCVV